MENLMFDYRAFGENLAIPAEIVKKFENEAHNEFPFDNMLMEIHTLRAIKAYAKKSLQAVTVEN
jgi:pentose-5-phosphate-3-epimerase